ncbi:glycerate kinase [Nocardioides litoris]|uniref:glycerate kinase family protein n=1 Tax=Nocardioides litoris TaxID=1926648 RepID=UPI00111DBA9F|nr:glycerate kinase [Nocardioides litoris]
MVAPDKFKGSLESSEVAAIVSAAIRRQDPTAHVVEHPVADGGEGTVALALRHGFSAVSVDVTGPLGSPVRATYAVRDDLAVVEMASAAGLMLLPGPPTPATLRQATTFGVGELVLDAAVRGARQIVVGVGGSATTDGGAGALEALGVDVAALGWTPHRPEATRAGLSRALSDIDLVVACDVDNPLTGPVGAAAMYAPQKGADQALVVELEDRLTDWAERISSHTGADARSLPGAGAAGGLAFGLVALAGARIVSGIDLIGRLTGLRAAVRAADLMVVGEGSLDEQSLRGKGPIGAARIAADERCTVIAIAGRNLLSESETSSAGIRAVYSLLDLEPDPEVCMREARRLLEEVAGRMADDWMPRLDRPGAIEPVVPLTPAEWREATLSTVDVVEDAC